MLEKSLTIKDLELKNRLVLPPMATHKSDYSGKINQGHIDYYLERAKGNDLGLIITEHSCICQQGRADDKQLCIGYDENIESFKELTDAIHKTSTKIICQINHAGSMTSSDITGEETVSASPVVHPRKPKNSAPRELSVEEIHQIQDLFVAAALRAKKAGYDGVEIHSAHGYLLNQFYSPLTNKRHDAYGCDSIENRTRFQVETIKKVREAVGENYPIFIRLGGCDYMEGGSIIEDAIQASLLFEQAGVDCIDLTGGMCGFVRIGVQTPGYFGDMSQAVKKKVKIPVLVTGGVKTVSQADALLEENKADLIGVGRGIMVDPNWRKNNL